MAMDGAVALQIEDVRKRFGRLEVLRGAQDRKELRAASSR